MAQWANDYPLQRSKAELQATRKAIERMRVAQKPDDFLSAWQEFLDRLEKVWKKAERECQDVRERFQPWQGVFTKKRREDPLLCYLYHARNADQHTVEVTAARVLNGLTITIPPKGTVVIKVDWETGQVSVGGEVLGIAPMAQKYLLLPFKDSGVDYDPPREHLGSMIQSSDPLVAAEMGLAFYNDFLEKAERKFFGQKDKSS